MDSLWSIFKQDVVEYFAPIIWAWKRIKGKRMYSRADYEVKLVDGVVVIVDLNLGNRSVTNDVENVLFDVSRSLDLNGMPVIYRDSEGVYDGINHTNGHFVGFYGMGETDLTKAVEKINGSI